jgi:hypothetical protein
MVRVARLLNCVAHPLGFGFTTGAVFDFVFGGDSFSFNGAAISEISQTWSVTPAAIAVVTRSLW